MILSIFVNYFFILLSFCEENLTNGLKAINLVEFLNINDLYIKK